MRALLLFILLVLSEVSFGQWTYQFNDVSVHQHKTSAPSKSTRVEFVSKCDSVTLFALYVESLAPEIPENTYVTIYIDNKVALNIKYTEFKKMSVPAYGYKINFKIPCDLAYHSGSYTLSIGKPAWAAEYLFKLNATTSILNALNSAENQVTYYTLQGLKVEKPTEGLYIWKSENGESGKIFIGAN